MRQYQYRPEDIRADLLYLRKGVGYTPERLARRSSLVQLLGGRGETPEVLHERLASAIWSLRDEDASVLWDMFRLSDVTGTATSLGERRDHSGSTARRRA